RAADAALPNLVDGRAYFVVNATATTFQLSATLGGTAISLNPGALTGGPHGFIRDGVNLTSAGSGVQSLVIDLTAASSGLHQLATDRTDTFIGAPSGDRVVTASATGGGIGILDIGAAN